MQSDTADKVHDTGRAVQFAPFDALNGYSERIAALRIKKEEKRILSDEAAAALSERLSEIHEKDRIKLKYYDRDEERYKILYCEVREADFVFRRLKTGRRYISFDDIEAVRIMCAEGKDIR